MKEVGKLLYLDEMKLIRVDFVYAESIRGPHEVTHEVADRPKVAVLGLRAITPDTKLTFHAIAKLSHGVLPEDLEMPEHLILFPQTLGRHVRQYQLIHRGTMRKEYDFSKGKRGAIVKASSGKTRIQENVRRRGRTTETPAPRRVGAPAPHRAWRMAVTVVRHQSRGCVRDFRMGGA